MAARSSARRRSASASSRRACTACAPRCRAARAAPRGLAEPLLCIKACTALLCRSQLCGALDDPVSSLYVYLYSQPESVLRVVIYSGFTVRTAQQPTWPRSPGRRCLVWNDGVTRRRPRRLISVSKMNILGFFRKLGSYLSALYFTAHNSGDQNKQRTTLFSGPKPFRKINL